MLYLFIILDNVLTVTSIIFIFTFNVISYIEKYKNIGMKIFLLFFKKIVLIHNIIFYKIT